MYKKGSKGLIAGIHGILLLFFGLIALLFISVALSLYIGEAIDDVATGYLIVGGFYGLVFLIVLLVFKPYIQKKVLIMTSKAMFGGNEDIKVDKYENVQELRGDR